MWIDYILYSSATMEMISAVLPECPATPIPGDRHPSDHLHLETTLTFKSTLPAAGALRQCRGLTMQRISPEERAAKMAALAQQPVTHERRDAELARAHTRLKAGRAKA